MRSSVLAMSGALLLSCMHTLTRGHTPLPQPIPFFETSAKEATRVEAAFLEAAQLALQQTSQEKDE
jgi:hypothetical protein